MKKTEIPNQITATQAVSSYPAPAPAKLVERDILFVEVDTTGVGYSDQVIEIAIVDINDKILFNSRFKPSMPIAVGATALHGLTDKDVAKSPTFDKLWGKIKKIFGNNQLAFYNAEFDTRLIAQTIYARFGTPDSRRHTFAELLPNNPVYCVMHKYAYYWREYSDYFGDYQYQKLNSAIRQQDIKTADLTHSRAVNNAIKTARLYRRMKAEGAA